MMEFIFDLFVEVFVELLFEGFIGEIILGNEGKPKLPLGVRIFILTVMFLVPAAFCFAVGYGNIDNIIVLLIIIFVELILTALYIAGLKKMLKNYKKYK